MRGSDAPEGMHDYVTRLQGGGHQADHFSAPAAPVLKLPAM
jgi:hypothetical protein